MPAVHSCYGVYLVNKFNKAASLCAIKVWAGEYVQISLTSLCTRCRAETIGLILHSARVNLGQARWQQTQLLPVGLPHLRFIDLICRSPFFSLFTVHPSPHLLFTSCQISQTNVIEIFCHIDWIWRKIFHLFIFFSYLSAQNHRGCFIAVLCKLMRCLTFSWTFKWVHKCTETHIYINVITKNKYVFLLQIKMRFPSLTFVLWKMWFLIFF